MGCDFIASDSIYFDQSIEIALELTALSTESIKKKKCRIPSIGCSVFRSRKLSKRQMICRLTNYLSFHKSSYFRVATHSGKQGKW